MGRSAQSWIVNPLSNNDIGKGRHYRYTSHCMHCNNCHDFAQTPRIRKVIAVSLPTQPLSRWTKSASRSRYATFTLTSKNAL